MRVAVTSARRQRPTQTTDSRKKHQSCQPVESMRHSFWCLCTVPYRRPIWRRRRPRQCVCVCILWQRRSLSHFRELVSQTSPAGLGSPRGPTGNKFRPCLPIGRPCLHGLHKINTHTHTHAARERDAQLLSRNKLISTATKWAHAPTRNDIDGTARARAQRRQDLLQYARVHSDILSAYKFPPNGPIALFKRKIVVKSMPNRLAYFIQFQIAISHSRQAHQTRKPKTFASANRSATQHIRCLCVFAAAMPAHALHTYDRIYAQIRLFKVYHLFVCCARTLLPPSARRRYAVFSSAHTHASQFA